MRGASNCFFQINRNINRTTQLWFVTFPSVGFLWECCRSNRLGQCCLDIIQITWKYMDDPEASLHTLIPVLVKAPPIKDWKHFLFFTGLDTSSFFSWKFCVDNLGFHHSAGGWMQLLPSTQQQLMHALKELVGPDSASLFKHGPYLSCVSTVYASAWKWAHS